MMGREGQAVHPFLYWEFHETDQIGLRMGDWKLVVVKGVPHLYDLSKDIHEDHDVAKKHPRLVKKMVGIIRSQHRDSPLFPVTIP
jgi:arylsulfatase